MFSGAEVEVNTASFKNDPAKIHNRDDIITYLIHLGYLGSLQYYFKPIREMPTGYGFADFTFEPLYDMITFAYLYISILCILVYYVYNGKKEIDLKSGL